MTTRNRILIPLCAVVVAVLVAALTYAVSARQPHSPAVLHLTSASRAGVMSAEVAPAAAGTSADARSSAGGYRLSGELPASRPDDAAVYALDGPWSTHRLAQVLDPAGLGTDHAAWWWSQPQPCMPPAPGIPESKPGATSAPDAPVSSEPAPAPATGDAGAVGCAGTGGGSVGSSGAVSSGAAVSSGTAVSSGAAVSSGPVATPVPPPVAEPTTPAMTEAEARAAAKPVLDAVDLSIDDARVTVTPWGASVWVNPVVHGLPTSGYTTRVELNQDKQISYASGFLGDLSAQDSYPLVTAAQAFDQLPAPMTEMLCRVGPNGQGCVPPTPPEVTGAVVGLELQQSDNGDRLLVPAWLFTVKGWTDPLAQVAVEGRYLGQPEPEPTAPVGKGGAGSTEPGTVIAPLPPASPPKG